MIYVGGPAALRTLGEPSPNAPNAPNAGLAGLAGMDRIALRAQYAFFL